MHLSETLVILLFLLPFILTVIAVIDIVKKDFNKPTDKIVWILVVVMIPLLGAILYFLLGRRKAIKSGHSISGY